jgi:hypothetical protein
VSRSCGQTFPHQLPLSKLVRLQTATYRHRQLRLIKDLSDKEVRWTTLRFEAP